MENLREIQKQIELLQKQAKEIRAKQFDSTVREILASMQAFGITAKDLQRAASRHQKPGGAPAKARTPARVVGKAGKPAVVAAKYRGPNGETWSGRGLKPRWLAAQVALGKSKEEFAITS